ncbi:MAG TPA: branched-chain amino acid ABC transporter permease [Actinophytocola sp.]|uniref:branched-chain amino acid ABC transporter permease n=1 Tax=Actinophytocola sp. TaxID=1872138 RepID=UPI002DDCC158|nr:branched-chain amino acid ABC transporter permease [Actinophytocola sp.]HEV2784369.1 branched-chain amino acid ABC transporter permease [Actinophytocola sp.]
MLSWLDANLVSILNGVAIGFLLFILAIGLSLIFGMMDVLNLAHGALFLLGAYLAWAIAGGDPSWGGFLLAIAVAALVGLASGGVLAVAVEPLRRRGHLDQALLTLGVALVAAELLALLFGRDVRGIDPPPGLDRGVVVLGDQYPVYRLALIGVGLVLAVVAHLVVERTTVGSLIRATVADRDMVSAIGVAQHRVRFAVLGLGSLMAAVAGVLGGPIYGARPGLDATVLILALVVVVIGGLGSVRGALVAALLIGQIESLGRAVLADAASFILFGALAIVLILWPQGLFARQGAR